jgi:hypothetical protein
MLKQPQRRSARRRCTDTYDSKKPVSHLAHAHGNRKLSIFRSVDLSKCRSFGGFLRLTIFSSCPSSSHLFFSTNALTTQKSVSVSGTTLGTTTLAVFAHKSEFPRRAGFSDWLNSFFFSKKPLRTQARVLQGDWGTRLAAEETKVEVKIFASKPTQKCVQLFCPSLTLTLSLSLSLSLTHSLTLALTPSEYTRAKKCALRLSTDFHDF